MPEVYIYDSLRTPFGKGNKNGALFEVKPIDLLSKCLHFLKERNELDTNKVEDLIVGCVIPVDGQADNIARTAILHSGWSETIPGLQINRFQASGLTAIALAAAKVKAGWENLIVAGGLESMSRIHREDNRGAISSDPDIMNRIGSIPPRIAADLVATIQGYTKNKLDKYAFQSKKKADIAREKGYLKKSIIPIYDQNHILILDKDETIESAFSLENLTKQESPIPKPEKLGFDAIALKKYPLIEQIIPLHSNGNIATPTDSAALMLMGNFAQGKALGLKARAKIIIIATISTELTITHLGGIKAAQKALTNAKLKPKDIDLWYINESFTAPALLFQQFFKLPDKKLNPYGGNIAFGDPLGANGTILLGMLMDELERKKLKRGLVALSAEGGIGTSMIIETINDER